MHYDDLSSVMGGSAPLDQESADAPADDYGDGAIREGEPVVPRRIEIYDALAVIRRVGLLQVIMTVCAHLPLHLSYIALSPGDGHSEDRIDLRLWRAPTAEAPLTATRDQVVELYRRLRASPREIATADGGVTYRGWLDPGDGSHAIRVTVHGGQA